MLREVQVNLSSGGATDEVCKSLGIAEQTDYRWRKSHEGIQFLQAKRLSAMENQNIGLKVLVEDQALYRAILEDILQGSY